MKIKRISILLVILAACVAAIPFVAHLRGPAEPEVRTMKGQKTVADRVAEFGAAARARLTPAFDSAGAAYPPGRVALVGLKAERMLEVWAAGPGGGWKHVRNYPILGQSGVLGPKMKEGDRQVPEGLYRVESLNPNSQYHVALKLNFPNDEDRRRAQEEGRLHPGSDIMIHGNTCSIGCLALGDEAAEDLFVLAAETGPDHVSIILSPVDFRVRGLPADMPPTPKWTAELYEAIRQALAELK